jgi:hypothetical protein
MHGPDRGTFLIWIAVVCDLDRENCCPNFWWYMTEKERERGVNFVLKKRKYTV